MTNEGGERRFCPSMGEPRGARQSEERRTGRWEAGADPTPGLRGSSPHKPEKIMEPPFEPLLHFLRRNNEKEGEEEQIKGEEDEKSVLL